MITFLEYFNSKELNKILLDQIGIYKIYTVNAEAIRKSSLYDVEYNDFATHLQFPKLVPNNEIWISNDIDKKEIPFFIHNGLHQYEGKKKKVKDWYDYALKLERSERKKIDGLKFHPKLHNKKPPQKVYYKSYLDIKSPDNNIKVWLVNGEVIRDLFKSDFVLGGNGYVYSWCPRSEIWIEKNLVKDGEQEIAAVILHEYVESTLMKLKKFSYDKAHNIASKVEFNCRKNDCSIDEIKNLNRNKALKMAEKYIKG